ncbi:MAG: ABC transporter permease [Planctomycetes bacterium]|nr:ABC transporter permease [Planctomycetota bacterium]
MTRTRLTLAALVVFALGASATEPNPVPKPKRQRVDLIVMQKNKPLGLDSDFGEYFVNEVRKIAEVERVSEGVVGVVNAAHMDGTHFLVQGWKPDNFGFEEIELTEGRLLKAGDTQKVLLGKTLASNLNRKVGDKVTFLADPETPYEVVGVFKSRVVFEQGGAIVSFKDGQHLTGKLVTGFSVRVKNPAADTAAVKQKIEALRDPKDPTVRLDALAPDRP